MNGVGHFLADKNFHKVSMYENGVNSNGAACGVKDAESRFKDDVLTKINVREGRSGVTI